MLVANFEYALVVCTTQSAVAKAFTAFQTRAVRKISCLDRIAPPQFDEPKAQNGCVAAANEQFSFFADQSSGHTTARAARQASGPLFRHRLAPDVAGLPAKRRISPRPWREAPHAIVDCI